MVKRGKRDDAGADLRSARSRIDGVDLRILSLLERRAALAVRVGRLKRRLGLPVYSADREEEILAKLDHSRSGLFPHQGVQNVFHEILRACSQVQSDRKRRPGGPGTARWKSTASESIVSLPDYVPGRFRSARGRKRPAIILASNENNYGTPPSVLKALKARLGEVYLYPDKWASEAATAVAGRIRCRPDQVVLANGSDELIDLVFRTFLRPGREALLPSPSFAYYEIAARACGARPVQYPLADFEYDIDELLRRVDERTAVAVVANPNSPTGTFVRAADLDRLLGKLPGGVVLLLDEAYWGYPTSPEFPDGMKRLKRHRNLIVMRTFSKIFGLAGLRCAYAVGEPELAAVLNKLRQPFNVNLLAQAAVVAAMKDTAWVNEMNQRNAAEANRMTKGLAALGVPFIPTQGNFLLVLPPSSGLKWAGELDRCGIGVRDTTSFGIPGGLRVTLGRPEENKRFLDAMRALMAACRNPRRAMSGHASPV